MTNHIINNGNDDFEPELMSEYLAEFERIESVLLPRLAVSDRNPARMSGEIVVDAEHIVRIQRIQTVNGYNDVERKAYHLELAHSTANQLRSIAHLYLDCEANDPELGTWAHGSYVDCRRKGKSLLQNFLREMLVPAAAA